ncbi:hypothetical protein [Ochrovirga pacifica]|uniref:hypothetical protein n=1 Tax=Ochrovirga pacifica TaxID=1042376 RepID=UPI0011119721|nr:hypothetical protein [Ochrovirga pacifica]
MMNNLVYSFLYSEKKDLDFSIIEKERGIVLPLSYKIFLNKYKVGDESLNKQSYLDEDIGFKLPLVSYQYKQNEFLLELDSFLSLETALDDRPYDDPVLGDDGLNLIRIAYSSFPSGGGVYLGLNRDNFGFIYRVDWDGDENTTAIKISNDLFQFLSILEPVIIDDNLDYTNFYKNWGEDFWRKKEV